MAPHRQVLTLHGRKPVGKSRCRFMKEGIMRPLTQFLAFSDMVVAVGMFLFRISTLTDYPVDARDKLVEVHWLADLIAFLLVTILNLLSSMVLFVGVTGEILVMLRLWIVSVGICMVYSIVVLWKQAVALTSFQIGFGICTLLHKCLLLSITTLFVRFLNQEFTLSRRRIFGSRVRRV